MNEPHKLSLGERVDPGSFILQLHQFNQQFIRGMYLLFYFIHTTLKGNTFLCKEKNIFHHLLQTFFTKQSLNSSVILYVNPQNYSIVGIEKYILRDKVKVCVLPFSISLCTNTPLNLHENNMTIVIIKRVFCGAVSMYIAIEIHPPQKVWQLGKH